MPKKIDSAVRERVMRTIAATTIQTRLRWRV